MEGGLLLMAGWVKEEEEEEEKGRWDRREGHQYLWKNCVRPLSNEV